MPIFLNARSASIRTTVSIRWWRHGAVEVQKWCKTGGWIAKTSGLRGKEWGQSESDYERMLFGLCPVQGKWDSGTLWDTGIADISFFDLPSWIFSDLELCRRKRCFLMISLQCIRLQRMIKTARQTEQMNLLTSILGLILLIRLNAQVDLIAVIYKLAMCLSCTSDSCLTLWCM